ncbi:MAG TPA: F0F1 ATP synthase subunit delta [Hyphomicrobiales bacterium]|nr:F0F1 ATP synthase subunit delta [Hyphomicrobiales bacterium]
MTGDDATVSGIARRYGSALYELAREQGAVDAVLADLDRFAGLLHESEDLRRLVHSPVFSAEEQLAAVTAVLARAGIGGLAGNFIRLTAKNRRLFAIADMIKAFRALVAQARGEVTAEVTLAERPSDARLRDIAEALRAVAGREVRLDLKVDPSIIGGLIVRLGSRMVDTSLKTKLTQMQLAMKEVR